MSTKAPKEAAVRRGAKPLSSVSATPASNTRLGLYFAAALIVLATFIAYQPALNAGFIWDDDDMLTENPLMRGGLSDIWFTTKFYDYYPLTLTSLWIEWRLWGMNPHGYHFVNVLLHSLTAVLFWRVLLRLMIPAAWLAALIFALHPVNVESVAWIAERKNTLPMVFYALSLLWFLRSEEAQDSQASWSKWYWLSLAAFLLALLSKTSVVMLPVVLLGCIWWLRGRLTRVDMFRTVPFFVVAFIFGLVTIWVQYNRAIAADVVQTAGFAERLARAGWAVWFYLAKAIVPLHLSFVYPRWNIDPRAVTSYMPVIALCAMAAMAWNFRERWSKPLLFGLGYFVVSLFPVLGFFNIYFQKYSFVADHWQYTSIVGIIALLVGVGGYFAKRQKWLIAVAAVGAIACGALTWQQCRIYKNDETLWTDTIRKNPQAAIAYQNLGTLWAERGDLKRASTFYESALAVKPDHEGAHYGLATGLAMEGKMADAVEHLREAVRIKPDYSMALNTLAWILATSPDERLRDGKEAVAFAERAVTLSQRKNVNYLDTLAAARAEAGDFKGAVEISDEAVQQATAGGEHDLVDGLRERQKLYRSRRPYREQP